MSRALVFGALVVAGCNGQGSALPTTLATVQGSPGGLAVDLGYVYWVSEGSGANGGTILRVSRGGGDPEMLATQQAGPFAIAAADTQLYWINEGTGIGDGRLMKMSKSGGTPVPLVDRQTAAVDLRFGVLAGGTQRVLAWTAPKEKDRGKRVKQYVIDAQMLNDALAPDQNRPDGLAVGPDGIYWTDFGTDTQPGSVNRRDGSTGQVVQLPQSPGAQHHPRGIAIDDQHVYWTDIGSLATGLGKVMRADIGGTGGEAKEIARDQPIGGRGRIAVSNKRVYWFNVTGSNHTLMSASIDGGPATEEAVARGSQVVDLVIFDRHVYWTVAGDVDGSVLTLPER